MVAVVRIVAVARMQSSTSQASTGSQQTYYALVRFTLAVVAQANPVPHPHAAASAAPAPASGEEPVASHL